MEFSQFVFWQVLIAFLVPFGFALFYRDMMLYHRREENRWFKKYLSQQKTISKSWAKAWDHAEGLMQALLYSEEQNDD